MCASTRHVYKRFYREKANNTSSLFSFSERSEKFKMKYCRIITECDNTLEHHGVMDMRWGIRRYQNKDGTLTELGKARLRKARDAEITKNADKYDPSKPEYQSRVDALEKRLNDPEAWVTEDTRGLKKVLEAGSGIQKTAESMERDSAPKPIKKKLNLNNISDEELRNAINRANLERQYNDLFAPTEQPKISKGRQFARNALAVSGVVLGTATSAVTLALAIRELRGH